MGQVAGFVAFIRKIATMTYNSYELKYCERCGGLGLRRSKSDSPYCCDCEQMMRSFLPELPATTTSRGQRRRIVQRVRQCALAASGETLAVQEAVHAS
jgi:hypothetical protein